MYDFIYYVNNSTNEIETFNLKDTAKRQIDLDFCNS